MDKLFEEIMDYSLLIAQSYLLCRIALSSNPYFKTPFFFFFLITGALGCLSVIGFIIASRMTIRAEQDWILKTGYITNTFGVTGSTMGKICIVAHRYAVMRNVKMLENIWSNRMNFILLGFILSLSSIRCIPSFFCGYTITVRDGINFTTYVDDECNVVNKSQSSVIYFTFIVVSIVLTALTIRQLYNLQRKVESQTRKLIVAQQRKVFIIVSVCTISHIIKAIHQFSWVFVAYFHLSELNAHLQKTYVYPHYLATYSASITLVIFSPRVRLLLLSMKDVEERSSFGTTPVF